MNPLDFSQKRILITQSNDFMGPVLCEVFKELGATVLADTGALDHPSRPAELIQESGVVDILLLNLGIPAPTTAVFDIDDSEWNNAFTHMVDPMPRLFKAVLPQMLARGQGKIILIGSASALRGIKRSSTYSAARGAQLAFIQAAGIELASKQIQVNGIAQNFVDNPTYFPPEVQANPVFQDRLKREVPLGRLVSAREDAMFVAYLASEHANCFVGQIFPVCGGWVNR